MRRSSGCLAALLAASGLCGLTACSDRGATPPSVQGAESPPVQAATVGDPPRDMRPKGPPIEGRPADPAGALHNPEVVHFAGFGPARFGDDQESVRIAWGRPLAATTPAPGSTCYYLLQDPPPAGMLGIAFMIESGQFVRYDIDDPAHAAPGDIVVGDTAEKVIAAHDARLEIQPHKYVQGGTNFVVAPPSGGAARVIFEMSPVGRVVSWRIGVPPQVDYVEGCS